MNLVINDTLMCLYRLARNNISPKGIKCLFDYLKEDKILRRLYVNEYEATDKSMRVVGEMLSVNRSINFFSIGGNATISSPFSSLLPSFLYSPNFITDQGAKDLSLSLKENRSLENMFLNVNQMTEEAVPYLCDILDKTSITALHVSTVLARNPRISWCLIRNNILRKPSILNLSNL